MTRMNRHQPCRRQKVKSVVHRNLEEGRTGDVQVVADCEEEEEAMTAEARSAARLSLTLHRKSWTGLVR